MTLQEVDVNKLIVASMNTDQFLVHIQRKIDSLVLAQGKAIDEQNIAKLAGISYELSDLRTLVHEYIDTKVLTTYKQ